MSSTLEAGDAIANAIVTALADAFDAFDLARPAILSTFTGTGIPLDDACDGLAWVRVGAVFPTDGSTMPFEQARISWNIPAWCIPIETGVLWCHENLQPNGSFIDSAREAEYAARDSAYRLAIMTAVAERWRPSGDDPLAQLVMGQRLDAWQPYGPDGGISGGFLVTHVVVSSLGICSA